MRKRLTIKEYGKFGLLIEWREGISRSTLDEILQLSEWLESQAGERILEIIPGYNSLTIICIHASSISIIKDLVKKAHFSSKSPRPATKHWEIPVCYEAEYAPDMDEVCQALSIDVNQVIDLHTGRTYDTYFTGFLPGFPYLGTLDKKLSLERKATPNLQVSAGSVAIANLQTGIYPVNSPGGWHVIGRTPWTLFDIRNDPPCLIQVGDQVTFRSVEKQHFSELQKRQFDTGK
jgi:inhibitor of KinA